MDGGKLLTRYIYPTRIGLEKLCAVHLMGPWWRVEKSETVDLRLPSPHVKVNLDLLHRTRKPVDPADKRVNRKSFTHANWGGHWSYCLGPRRWRIHRTVYLRFQTPFGSVSDPKPPTATASQIGVYTVYIPHRLRSWMWVDAMEFISDRNSNFVITRICKSMEECGEYGHGWVHGSHHYRTHVENSLIFRSHLVMQSMGL